MPSSFRLLWAVLFITFIGCLTACSTETPLPPTASPTRTTAPTETPLPPTATATSTATATATASPTASPTATITNTPTPSDTPTPSATPTETPNPWVLSPNTIRIYLVIPDTGGPVGCGDTLVGVSAGYLRTGDVEEDVRLAMNTLFATGEWSGDLYNATHASSFRVSGVDYTASSSEVRITLSGSYAQPDDYCDARRYREQVWATARQFPEIDRAFIALSNGKLLGDLLAVFWDNK